MRVGRPGAEGDTLKRDDSEEHTETGLGRGGERYVACLHVSGRTTDSPAVRSTGGVLSDALRSAMCVLHVRV
jgi:hypothetical protein